MQNSKTYQYSNLVMEDAFTYSGTLAVELTDGTRNNVKTPVNTTDNTEVVETAQVLADTLSNQEDN